MKNDDQTFIRVTNTAGDTVTCDPGLIVAIATTRDRKKSTLFLRGDVRIVIDGGGEKVRKRVYGATYKAAKGSSQEKQEQKKRRAVERRGTEALVTPPQWRPKPPA